ncbi:uncharacterized protein LOC132200765 isoform X2 [Neocloeon triangulifer]|uniref:uncharacterized protein LOC132200765 isoform X2 n=1 Tax=Neocloeon triangulifer TaxID=2078957 RepID=UPI00286F1EF7|nr:uncharacterized protein LOC132200765 isoform X2 [Neocloeon triangulifer]
MQQSGAVAATAAGENRLLSALFRPYKDWKFRFPIWVSVRNCMSSKPEKKKSKSRRRAPGQPALKRAASESCPCAGEEAGALERRSLRSHTSLRCSLCGSVVCRACSRVVRPSARIRLCGTCYQHRDLSNPSGEWFYRQLQTKFHDVIPSSSSENSIDASLEVREFIERLTENLVGGSVDDVTVEPLSSQIEYEQLCSEFHPKVQDALTRLSGALQVAITDLSTVKLGIGESPSEIHVQLKKLVSEMRAKSYELPLLEMDTFLDQEGGSPLRKKSPIDFSQRTYEDLLSTAIINKIVEGGQCALMEQHLRTPACNSCNNDKTRFITCLKIGVKDTRNSAKGKPASRTNSTAQSRRKLQRVSKEEVDSWSSTEDTDEDEFTDEGNETPTPKKKSCTHSKQSEMAKFFDGLKYSTRVPFPELGADIVEGSVQDSMLDDTARSTLYLVHSDSHHSSLSSASWEENWLFQKKRLNFRSTNRGERMGRVPMLVPNPKHEHQNVRAKIGDTDADQLSSDLSDYESYMSREEETTSFEGDNEPSSFESADRQEADSKLPPDFLIEATNQEMQGTVVGTTLILAPPSANGTESHEFDQQEGEYLEDFASVGHRSFYSLHGDSNENSMPSTPTSESLSKAKSVPDILESAKNAISASPTPSAREEQVGANDEHLFKPPMPGTLAEREHLKWQQARPIPNNPYSEENIVKRLHERKRSSAFTTPISSNHSNVPVEAPQPTEPEEDLRIVCTGDGVRDIKKYRRDYYINLQESQRKEMEQAGENGSEVPSSQPSSVVEEAPATLSEPSLYGSTDDLLSEIESLRMPSVKELSKQFDILAPRAIERRQKGKGHKFDKDVIIIESTPSLTPAPPVHSLTARSLSSNVRASLQGDVVDAPKPAARHLANLEFWRQQQAPIPAPRRK